MLGLFRRHKPGDAPEVREAIAERDDLFAKAKDAMVEVDRVQQRIIDEYAEAEADLLAERGRKAVRKARTT